MEGHKIVIKNKSFTLSKNDMGKAIQCNNGVTITIPYSADMRSLLHLDTPTAIYNWSGGVYFNFSEGVKKTIMCSGYPNGISEKYGGAQLEQKYPNTWELVGWLD